MSEEKITNQQSQVSGPEALLGKVIADRYELLEIVGQGGIGVVYKARHTFLDRIVAFKMLRAETLADDRSVQRFQLEAKAISALSHPNIVSIFDFGVTPDNRAFLVMDYLDGTDLDTLIQSSGYLEPDEVVSIFVQICDALAQAHAHGIIHRDIKPGNVVILNADTNAQVKLVDFGMAKFQPIVGREVQALTRPGEVFGSPYYMSPEQCTGMVLDQRSDIYSTGCVMYEALTGRPPFLGENMVQLAEMHIKNRPEAIGEAIEADFPPWLETIVFKTLEKNVLDRYQNAHELKKALVAFKRGWLQRTTSRLNFKTVTGEFVDFNSESLSNQTPTAAEIALATDAKFSDASAATIASKAASQRAETSSDQSNSVFGNSSGQGEMTVESGLPKMPRGMMIGIILLSVISITLAGTFFLGRDSSKAEEWQNFDLDGNKALSEGRLTDAEYNFSQAVRIADKSGDMNNPALYKSLSNLGTVFQREGKFEMAETIYKEAVERIERNENKTSPSLVPVLVKLAQLLRTMHKLDQAEEIHLRTIEIIEGAFGHNDQRMIEILNEYAQTKKQGGEHDKAAELQAESQKIKSSTQSEKAPELPK